MQQRHGRRPFGSLTAHLLEAGDHGRLGFHPRCPVCRKERLFGSLSSERLTSRCVQAALATGVLAFSTAAPGAAVAAVPDRQKEGVAAPGPRSGGDLDSPDFDPGGETALPFEVAPTPTSPVVGGGSEDAGDGPPVESDPVVDPDAHLLAPTTPETVTPPTETDAPVPPAEVAPVSPAPPTRDRVTIEAPPANAETPTSPNTPDAGPGSEPAPKQQESDRRRRAPSKTSPPAEPPQAPPIGVAPQSPPPGSPLPAAAVAETVPVVQASAPSEASQGPLPETARWHVVEPGESLWSIATRLLGPDATPGRIAREVERLWELNRDRIGTGDRDLLMVGAKLRLR
jgi:LysM domain